MTVHCMASTGPVVPKPQEYMGRVLRYWLNRHSWILVIPLCICGSLAVHRWEWLIVALMFLLIVYPFAMSLVYFSYGMKPETQKIIRPAKFCFSHDKIKIIFLKRDEKEENGEKYTEFHPIEEEERDYNSIKSFETSGHRLTLRLNGDKYASFSIPDEAWVGNDKEKTKNTVIDVLTKNGITFA